MKRKNEIREELKELSPFLLDMKDKGEGFKVPKNYFKSLPDEVLKKVRETPESMASESKMSLWDECIYYIQWLFNKPQGVMTLASVAILMIAGIFFFQDGPADSTELIVAEESIINLDDVPLEAIDAYIKDNIEEFSEDLLVNTEKSTSENFSDFEFNEEMEDALIDELLEEMEPSDIADIL